MIIATTANAIKGDAEKCLEAGTLPAYLRAWFYKENERAA
jgi:hypothetical protein